MHTDYDTSLLIHRASRDEAPFVRCFRPLGLHKSNTFGKKPDS